ncbi:hypothetical protein D3C76_1469170 [compost metagenome]
MRQGRFEFFQDVTVDLGFLALDLQPYLLAETTTEVTDHPYLAAQHIGKRPHATSQGRVVQHLGALTGLPGELVQLGVFFHQQLLGFSQEPTGIFEGFPGFEAQGLVLEVQV